MQQDLTIGIGASLAKSADEAGTAAATAAMAPLGDEPAALVIVFASVTYDLPALISSIRAVTGKATLVGASSCGNFHEGTYNPVGSGVEVLALTAGPYRFGATSTQGVTSNAEEAGRAVTRGARLAAGPDLPPHAALLLFTDGLAGNQQAIMNGAYAVAGAAVPVVGGSSSDDRQFSGTYLFHDDKVIADGAVAVWIGSERPLVVVSKHGWTPTGLPMMVTRVDGQHVREISGRPAMEVYRQRTGDVVGDAQPGVYSTSMASRSLGLIEPDGSHVIHAVRMGDDEDDLVTFIPLPQFAAISVMTGTPDDLLAITEPLVAEALAGRDARVLLTFSCAGRQDILLDRVPEEVVRLQAAAGVVPTFGFFTYGEFARVRSVAGCHNATIAAIAL